MGHTRSSEEAWFCCQCRDGPYHEPVTIHCTTFACYHCRCSSCRTTQGTSVSTPSGSSAQKSSKKTLSRIHKVHIPEAPQDRGIPVGGLEDHYDVSGSMVEIHHSEEKELEFPTPQSLTPLEILRSPENEALRTQDILMSPGWRTRSLIPLVSAEQEDDPIYPLDAVKDAALLDQWNNVILATINAERDDFKGYNSIHLFRQGDSQGSTRPTIMVSMEDSTSQEILHQQLSRLIVPPLRSNCQILFEESAIRRTGKAQLPPICEPRNIGYTSHPDFGASVGLKGRVDSTATLGGYLVVDNQLLLMTVDHLIGDNDTPVLLTHPSEQEALNSKHWVMLEDELKKLKKCCIYCEAVYKEHCFPERCYSPVLDSIIFTCALSKKFRNMKERFSKLCPRETLGSLVCRSTTRSRPTQGNGEYNVEMDWALCNTDQWPEHLGLQAIERARNLHFSEIIPGACVTATGRTSGNQLGIISTAMSIIRHGIRITQEWSILRDPSSTVEDWIKGGIGVDGDSGAWILDRESGAIYGMVWGRNQPTTRPICLFSPIEDIVADIKERTGAIEVCLPGQETRAIRTTPMTEHQLKEKEVHGKGKSIFIESSYQGAASARYL